MFTLILTICIVVNTFVFAAKDEYTLLWTIWLDDEDTGIHNGHLIGPESPYMNGKTISVWEKDGETLSCLHGGSKTLC